VRLLYVSAIAGLVTYVAGAANATATTSDPVATRICLGAAGAEFDYNKQPFITYREEMHQLHWVVGHNRLGDTVDINIFWTPNRASAARLEGQFARLGGKLGLPKSDIKPLLGRLGNVVWLAGAPGYPATTAEISLLKRCLSR
jgi:hypothetical protein